MFFIWLMPCFWMGEGKRFERDKGKATEALNAI